MRWLIYFILVIFIIVFNYYDFLFYVIGVYVFGFFWYFFRFYLLIIDVLKFFIVCCVVLLIWVKELNDSYVGFKNRGRKFVSKDMVREIKEDFEG